MGTRTPLAASFSRTAAATAAASARGAWASPSPSGVGFGSSSPSKPLGVDANAPVGPSGPNPAPFVASTAMTGTVSPGPPHATGSRRLDTTKRSRSHCSDASYAGESTATTAAAPAHASARHRRARAVVAEVAVRDVESVEPDERT